MLDPNMAVVLNNALSLAELAGAYEKKASDVIASYQQRDQMAVEKRASTLKLLVDLGFVPQGREKEASDLLSSHANTLELLENLAHKTAGYRKQARQHLPGISAGLSARSRLDLLRVMALPTTRSMALWVARRPKSRRRICH